MKKEKLIVKKKKCHFAAKSVEFLGYTISENKIQPLISRCAAIDKFPTSKTGLGAVLEEITENGKLVGVVGYYSKTLQGAQKNYSAGDLELLAIVEALSHFKYMLHGLHFTLRTDHINLLTAQNNKEPSRWVNKWLNELSEFDFKLEYLAGPKNLVADAISRADYTVAAIEDAAVLLDPKSWYYEYLTDPLCTACLVYISKINEENLRFVIQRCIKSI